MRESRELTRHRQTLVKEQTALAAQYRRLVRTKGQKRALAAAGHIILVIAYHTMKRRAGCEELGGDYFDRQSTQRLQRQLIRRLERLGLILGLYTLDSALLSGLMPLIFASAMTFATGVKAPLNYSVFTAAAAAFLLAAQTSLAWSVDSLVGHSSAKYGSGGLRAARRRGPAEAPKGARPVTGND